MVAWKGIAWNLQCLAEDGDFYGDVAPILVDLIPETFFWSELTHLRSSRTVKLTRARFETMVRSKHRSWDLIAGTERYPALSFVCHRIYNALSFTLHLHDDAWTGYGAALAGLLEALNRQFVGALRDRLLFRGDSGVRPSFYPTLEVPQLDPEPDHPMFRFDLVMNILDRRLVADLERIEQPDLARDMKRACAARPPRGARRVVDGDVSYLFWTDAMHDQASLVKGVMAQKRWLAKAIAPKRG